ncbi:MAG: TVP38/TMEM64 family protein [Candidatus Nanoarchaeia archaeon]|nr:TVP38/TMEM64 family protein [Candidatus Nanoarchaeia archaeon]MDD5239052.1 TVP38/TMEM64 family protein [Candidatus Nanoarchaeia archaeon]
MEKTSRSWFAQNAWLLVIAFLVLLNFAALWVGYNNNYQKIASFLADINPELITEFVKSFGMLAPVIIVIIFILESILAPIPGQIVTIAAGSLYGPLWGSLLAIFGTVLGSVFPFYISRFFGRPIVEKLVSPKQLEKADRFFSEHKGILVFAIIRILPIATFDVISYSAGLTKMSFWKYLVVTLIATIPKVLIYTNIGHFLVNGSFTAFVILAVITVIGAFTMFAGFWLFKKLRLRRRASKAEAEGED